MALISKINTIILAGFSVIFVLFGKGLVGIFTDSPQAISKTYPLLILLACAVPFIGTLNIYTAALQGSRDTKTTMYSTLFGIWVIRLGGGFFFTQELGIAGFGWSF
ncbi:MAG: MATE family efflux transporter [Eubacteriales bacterium]